MPELTDLDLEGAVACTLPQWGEVLDYIFSRSGPSPSDVLREADRNRRPVIQPRCGVGDHASMVQLLRTLEAESHPGVLSVTIDSHTRLKRFATAARTLQEAPEDLNGYPLIAHGWRRGRELTEAVAAPLEVRHGSPDARELFAVAVASGILSFEGGGISYNLPYSKDVPLSESLAAWRQVDAACGDLARDGVVIDREFFGTLSAVLVPPSISIAISMIEAMTAAQEGVQCLSVAYPQGGEAHQDVAALQAIRRLAAEYLPSEVAVYPVLHEFMGVFPRDRGAADALICLGGLVGRLGGATKIVNKTYLEAYGIPDVEANSQGIRLAGVARSDLFDVMRLDDDRIAEEQEWIERETAEIIDPVVESDDVSAATVKAFRTGTLDIPFSASVHARSAVIPGRDRYGAIRYASPGLLPLSPASLRRNYALLADRSFDCGGLIGSITADINYFLH